MQRLRLWLSLLLVGHCLVVPGLAAAVEPAPPVNIGTRLELFVDAKLVDHMEGVEFYLHAPCRMPLPEHPLPVPYTTVLKDGDRYRAYYRDILPGYDGERFDGHPGELTCYAESRDGHEWTFPDLGILDVKSSRGRNVILAGNGPETHNFTPFIDTRPGVDPEARYKALGGTHPGGGLYAFQSADGLHWKKMQEAPVLTSEAFAFDSQNPSFWSVAEGRYVCFFRTWDTPHGELRTVSRSDSADFLHWSEPVPLNPNEPGEHIYTPATQPYFRAPHIYIALPTRFFPDRGDSTDIAFMSIRAGEDHYSRLFKEAFIRPGPDPERWGNRSNYVALNVVPTGPSEMSIYHKDGHRYVLRTDGFISIRAGSEPGELLTKPVIFTGSKLVLNVSTSAGGSLRVELQDADGRPLPGYGLEDNVPVIGDAIAREVEWTNSPDLSAIAGRPVRIRFVMTECDLYSFRFRE